MKYIILLILIIFSINGVCAEPFIEQYSNSYSSDSCLFVTTYYTNVSYTIVNNDNLTKTINIMFLNSNNHIVKTKKIIILENSSFNDNTIITTGISLFLVWNVEEAIHIKISSSIINNSDVDNLDVDNSGFMFINKPIFGAYYK